MIREDAAGVIAYLSAAFPRNDIGVDALEVFFESALSKIDPELAMDTARRVIATDQWFPTAARFSEVRRDIERARQPATRALPAARRSVEEREHAKQAIANIRKTIAMAKRPPHLDGFKSIGETLAGRS